MADADDTKAQEDSKSSENDAKPSGGGMLQWIIMAVVVVVCAGAGLGLGRLFAGTGMSKTTEPIQQDQSAQTKNTKTNDSTANTQQGWFYNLDPVIACLDEPGATRYIRATLTLEISSTLNQKQGTVMIEEKKPILANWLSLYLAGLKIDDIRGDKKQKRIQSQILNAFNEKLFPDAKPQIKRVLFKEFVVQ